MILKCSHRQQNQVHIVTLQGHLVADTLEAAQQVVYPLLEDQTAQALLINCEALHFIDSTGTGFFTTVYKRCQKRHLALMFCDVSKKYMQLLRMLNLHQLFKIAATEAEALQTLQENR